MLHRPVLHATAALAVAAVIAGCGSSKPASTITVGAEPSGSQSSAAPSTPAPTQTVPAAPASIPTPTSGPLSKEPKVTAPRGAVPATLSAKDIIKGTGPVAKVGQMVTVNYVGVLFRGGKLFDASWNRKQTFTFPLGQGQVIPGWDQGVPGMKVGGRRELIIPAKLAYGAQGQPPTIPPNAPLVFVIDLLGV
jgi:FKBP-type peptidyl-prolyl cis-trans isomerase